MRKILAAALVALGTAPAGADPGQEIEAVIRDQLAAFERKDVAGAYAYASPGIKRIFPSGEVFGQMVERGYPMIWQPGPAQMGDLVESPRGPIQQVTIQDRNGRLFEAFYLMQEIDGRWRINGVQVRALPGVAS